MTTISESKLHLLKRLVPLNTLSDEKLNQLLEYSQFNELNSGEFLFLQGDTVAHNIYVLLGTVALLFNGKEEDQVVAGSDSAKFPLAHQIPRKYSARALTDLKYVSIDNRRLSELLGKAEKRDYQVEELAGTESEDWMSHLLQSRVFQHLPAANIQRIIMRMEEVKVDSGQEVVTQGGEGNYFYIIHEGKAVITMEQQSDAKTKVRLVRAWIGPGDSFGEEALLSDSPRNSSVTMMTPGVLLRLGKEDFIQLVTRPLAKAISYNEAIAKIEEGAIFLDVRTEEKYEAEHIMGSINLESRLIRREASHLAPERHYIIYSGLSGHSASSAFVMTEMGFDVSVLKGGIDSVPQDALVDLTHSDDSSSALVNMLHPEDEEGDAREANSDFDSLENQLKEARNKIEALTCRLDEYKQTEAQWESQLDILKNALEKSKSLLEDGKQQRLSDQATISQLQQERDELKASLAQGK